MCAEEEQWGREGMGDRGVLRVLSNNWRYGGQSSHFQFLSYYSPQLLFCFVFLIIEPQIPKFCLNWFATLFSLVYFLRIDRLPRAGWFHSHSAKGKGTWYWQEGWACCCVTQKRCLCIAGGIVLEESRILFLGSAPKSFFWNKWKFLFSIKTLG